MKCDERCYRAMKPTGFMDSGVCMSCAYIGKAMRVGRELRCPTCGTWADFVVVPWNHDFRKMQYAAECLIDELNNNAHICE